MSIISNRHQINLFVSGKSEALTGQRLAKVGYKSTSKTPAKFPSICVSVPPIADEEIQGNISALLPHVKAYLADVQDKVIRSLYESSGGTKTLVSNEEISVSACIGYLMSEGAGGKLSAELIEHWFDTEMKDNLTVVFADKLGFSELNDEQMETVSCYLASYRALFAQVSATKNAPSKAQCENLRKVLEVAATETDVGERIANRLAELLKEPTQKVAQLLDF